MTGDTAHTALATTSACRPALRQLQREVAAQRVAGDNDAVDAFGRDRTDDVRRVGGEAGMVEPSDSASVPPQLRWFSRTR